MQVTMTVNGDEVTRDVEPRLLLVHFVRDHLGLTGTHWGCDTSNCGTCVLWMDGEPVKSCTVLAAMADGREIRTVEDLDSGGELDPLQQGFMQCHGLQCGFCTPGMLMTARWLLDHDPDPSEGPIREAISGQFCRCTGYENIVRSIRWAAEHPEGATTEGRGRDHDRADLPGHQRRHAGPRRPTPPTGPRSRSARRATPSASAACSARRTPGSCAARATTSTTSSCRACCYGAILRSPFAHARIVSIDTSAAEAHPKVKAVITGATLESSAWRGCRRCRATPRRCWPPTRCGSRARRWRSSSPTTATPPATRSS